MIDRRLQTLRALYQERTVTAAAAALHLTPSTVSQQLRQLAHDLDIVLMEADGRCVRLTPAAHALLNHADRLFETWEHAQADLAKHRSGLAGEVRMSGISSAVAAFLAPAAARLRETHPDIAVILSEEESDDCFTLLLTEHTDIAVMIPTQRCPASDDSRFEQESLLDEPQDILLPIDHPLAARPCVQLSEFADECWIAEEARSDQYQLLVVACTAAGFTPRIVSRGKEWFAIAAMVAHGYGVCLIPRLAPIPPSERVVRVPLAGNPTPSRRIITCVRRGTSTQPHIAAALDSIRSVRADFIASQPKPPTVGPGGPGTFAPVQKT